MIVRPIEYIVGRQNGRFAPKKSFVPRDVTITKEGRIRYLSREILRFCNLHEPFHLLYFHMTGNGILTVDYKTCRLI
jgi:hypothetical protein